MSNSISFYHFDTRDAMDRTPIKDTDIAFCREDGVIKTHGDEYGKGKVDSELSDSSTNSVQNKVIKAELDKKQNKLIKGTGIDIDEETNIISGTEVSILEQSPITGSENKLYFEVTEDDDEFYIDTEAPLDSKTYGRKNGTWVEVLDQSSADERYALKETYQLGESSEVNTLESGSIVPSPMSYTPNIPSIHIQSDDKYVSISIDPNKYYKFDELYSLEVYLNEGNESMYNEYTFRFKSGSIPTTLDIKSSENIKWIGGSMPLIEPNKTYVVSISDNLAIMGGW